MDDNRPEDKKRDKSRNTQILTSRILSSLDKAAAVKLDSAKLSQSDVLNVFVKLFMSIQDPVIMTDLNMGIIEINSGFEKLTGFKREDVMGFDIRFLYADSTPADTLSTINRALKTDGFYDGEILCKKKNGEEWYSWVSISTGRSADSEPFAYVHVARDITERKRLEENMRMQLELAILAQKTILSSLANLAEFRDNETGIHLERMRSLCHIIAKALKEKSKNKDLIQDEFIAVVADAAILHDIGKVGIPDRVLLKPAKLTEEEWKTMKQHTLIGGKILLQAAKQMPYNAYLKMAADIAFFHHEKFDGSGYPYGIAGESIPLCARIVAIADAYDCIRSPRVYKPPFPHDEAKQRVLIDAGKHFDPLLVKFFTENEEEFATQYK
jgi:putative two-component system response regulator